MCKEIIQATDEELEGNQLLAGLSGFNKEKGVGIVHKWCNFCSIKECVTVEHWLKEPMPIMSNGKQFVIFGHKLLTVQKHGIFMNLEV